MKYKSTILLILLALIATLAVVSGCPLKKSPPPPIILAVIDTLRADHVGAYGYSRPTTPNLDELAGKGIVFKHAHAGASWTVPSMNSLFTGVYPWSHGVVYAETAHASVRTQQKLSDHFVTLAEMLKEKGYATFGVSANYHMHEQYGVAQGFDDYKAFSFSDREPVDRQLKFWLPKIKRVYAQKKPYFLFVHWFDPHHPYKYSDSYTAKMNPDLTRETVKQYAANDFVNLATSGFFFENPDKMQLLVDLYDGEIAAADESLGTLLAALPGLEEAVIVVTADHGEAFGEHTNMIHGRDLYAETVRVPLVFKLPGQYNLPPVAIEDQVSLVDVYPTLAALASAEKPEYLEGVDLAPLWNKKSLAERMLFTMTRRATEQTWYGIISPRYKLVHNENINLFELFDMSADPTEQNSLYKKKKKIALELRRLLAKSRRPNPVYNPGITGEAMSDELRETLRGLGYL